MNTKNQPNAIDQMGSALVKDQAVLALGGRHRMRWLHRMITQDVQTLQPGQGRYACVVDIKGKVQQDFQLYNDVDGEQLLLLMDTDRIERFVTALQKYIVAEQITFDDQSKRWCVLTVQGPGAVELVGSPDQDVTQAQWGDVPVRVVRNQRGLHPGFDLWTAAESRAAVEQILKDRGVMPLSEQALDTARIEAAIPKFGVDMDDGIIPLEAGMMDAIHWEKGCYVGQEVLARMFHRGHTNKELRQLRMSGAVLPAHNAELFGQVDAQKPCGRVTSAAHSTVEEGVVALGYVRREFFEPGTTLWVDVENGRTPIHVTDRAIRSTFIE